MIGLPGIRMQGGGEARSVRQEAHWSGGLKSLQLPDEGGCMATSTVARFRKRVRMLTRRVRGISLRRMVRELSQYLLGWRAYFGYCQTPTILRRLDKWIRRRLRAVVWKQWQRPRTRYRELRKRGVNSKDAHLTARGNRGPWRVTLTAALCWALPGAFFASLGLPPLERP